ncbi:MAG: hypothetical protein KDE57_08840 [Calditrichaeota bacterium]|nr:hypothetical protein [Calditrichota bacterium]MCB9066639.1 hypothetical protein [Calditrichia bacterium]
MNKYHTLPANPENITAGTVISRLLASIGFRYYWATDDLPETVAAFQPENDARSIAENMAHIWDILQWVHAAIHPETVAKPEGLHPLRTGTLALIETLEHSFSTMDVQTLAEIKLLKQPFWPLINGPLSDVLTHIGQIAMLRRIAGFPVSNSDPFLGTPPPGK